MNLLNTNWRYYLDIDYYYDTGNCDCYPDYCRCGTIENAKINHGITGVQAVNACYKKENDFVKYCIDRICTCFKIWEPDNYYIAIENGYYGEEIGSVNLETKNIQESIDELLKLKTNKERLEFVLVLEYGFLLDSLKDISWSIEKATKKDIHFSQDNYHMKINPKSVEVYKDYPFARGVVLEDGGKYRVIDGYHRLSAAPQKAKFPIIVGKPLDKKKLK